MTYDDPRHHRRSIRMPAFDYAGAGAYFTTIVTLNRACLFGRVIGCQMQSSPQGHIADECWRAIPAHFSNVDLGEYVVMPNHIHGIIILRDRTDADVRAAMKSLPVGAQYIAPLLAPPRPRVQPCSLGSIIRTYKAAVTRAIVRKLGGVPRIWQRNYYEHVIRDDKDWRRVQLYIEANVANWADDDENP